MRKVLAVLACLAAAPAFAQAPPVLGDSAKSLLGSWEFSNAARDRVCTVTFKPDKTAVGFKVEFDSKCANVFPLVGDVAGWTFPDNDLLRLLDAQGRAMAEFSEVETGIYEAPTPGVGVLFLQNASGGPPPEKTPQQVAGDWTVMQGEKALCTLTLAATAVKDAFALSLKPGCDQSIVRLGLTQWKLDDDELLLSPARGNPWRFEEVDSSTWRRVPEGATPIMLVRQ